MSQDNSPFYWVKCFLFLSDNATNRSTAKLVEFFPWGSLVNGLLLCCHSVLTITVVNFILQKRNLSDTQLPRWSVAYFESRKHKSGVWSLTFITLSSHINPCLIHALITQTSLNKERYSGVVDWQTNIVRHLFLVLICDYNRNNWFVLEICYNENGFMPLAALEQLKYTYTDLCRFMIDTPNYKWKVRNIFSTFFRV